MSCPSIPQNLQIRKLAFNYVREQGFPALRNSICRSRSLCGKMKPPRAVLLPYSGGEENRAQSVSDCGVFLNLTNNHTTTIAKKISQKDFLR